MRKHKRKRETAEQLFLSKQPNDDILSQQAALVKINFFLQKNDSENICIYYVITKAKVCTSKSQVADKSEFHKQTKI